MTIDTSLWAIALSLVVSCLLPVALTPVLRRGGVIDVPNHRSSHVKATVRGGGIAVGLSIIAGAAVALIASAQTWSQGSVASALAIIIVSTLGFGILGFIEDLRGLPVIVRILGQFTMGIVLGLMLLDIQRPIGIVSLTIPLIAVLLVNASNFMDGINGLSGVHGALFGAYAAAMGGWLGSPVLVTTSLIVSAAFIGFLPWNFPRATMFLGDVGSYVLGGAALTLLCVSVRAGVPWILAVAPLTIYIGDVLMTLAKRASKGASLTTAHREHTYQRLAELSGSHAIATLVTSGATVTCAAVGASGLYFNWPKYTVALTLVAVLMVYNLMPLAIKLVRARQHWSDRSTYLNLNR